MPIPDDAIAPAVLLDSENRLLSSGEARIYTAKGYGVFWPQSPANEDLILKSAAIVQMSTGEKIRIRNVQLCWRDDSQPRHFEFALC